MGRDGPVVYDQITRPRSAAADDEICGKRDYRCRGIGDREFIYDRFAINRCILRRLRVFGLFAGNDIFYGYGHMSPFLCDVKIRRLVFTADICGLVMDIDKMDKRVGRRV